MLDKELADFAEATNIWWGVSVEDRKYGVPRIKDLQSSNAKVRFLSVEPLLEDLGELDLSKISWVIVGGESGYGARPMQEEWVISIRNQCEQQRVPFFFKQWGGVQKKKYGRLLQGRLYDASPPLSEHKIPSRTGREELIRRMRIKPLQLNTDLFTEHDSLPG
jgi:protein gp37